MLELIQQIMTKGEEIKAARAEMPTASDIFASFAGIPANKVISHD